MIQERILELTEYGLVTGLVEPEEEEKKEEAEEPEDQAPLFDSFQGIKFSD